jgi:hypothetical protein
MAQVSLLNLHYASSRVCGRLPEGVQPLGQVFDGRTLGRRDAPGSTAFDDRVAR